MSTEADTCRKLVTPKLQAAGWDNDPHSIAEQRFFTDGRIVVHGMKAIRRPGKRTDRVKRQQFGFFSFVGPEARESLKDLLERHAADAELQLTLPEVVKVPVLSQHGSVNEDIGRLDGAGQFRQPSVICYRCGFR